MAHWEILLSTVQRTGAILRAFGRCWRLAPRGRQEIFSPLWIWHPSSACIKQLRAVGVEADTSNTMTTALVLLVPLILLLVCRGACCWGTHRHFGGRNASRTRSRRATQGGDRGGLPLRLWRFASSVVEIRLRCLGALGRSAMSHFRSLGCYFGLRGRSLGLRSLLGTLAPRRLRSRQITDANNEDVKPLAAALPLLAGEKEEAAAKETPRRRKGGWQFSEQACCAPGQF